MQEKGGVVEKPNLIEILNKVPPYTSEKVIQQLRDLINRLKAQEKASHMGLGVNPNYTDILAQMYGVRRGIFNPEEWMLPWDIKRVLLKDKNYIFTLPETGLPVTFGEYLNNNPYLLHSRTYLGTTPEQYLKGELDYDPLMR